MSRWSAISNAGERVLLSVLIFLVFGLLMVQLGTRLIGTSAFGFAEEAARYLFIWLVFLGSGFAVRRGGHIMADILRPKSTHAVALAWLVVLEGILCAAALALFWYGVQLTMISANTGMVSLELSMAWRSAAVPAGAALMAVFSLAQIGSLLGRMRGGAASQP
jgi:TRAP-type C4-dicarboxylate transport system permease small subunit